MSFKAYVEKKYGTILVKNLLLTAIFTIVFIITILLMKPFWDIGNDTILTKIGTMTSITGVFLGTYIALWLINQNRTKRIEENFYYKIAFLTKIQGILSAVYQICFAVKVEVESETYGIDRIRNMVTSSIPDFEYWKGEIEKINSNNTIPAEIRSGVSMLLHQGIKPISIVQIDLEWQKHMAQTTVLDPLDRIINSSYFVNDSDHDVQHYLKQVVDYRKMISDAITPSNVESKEDES